MKWLLSTALAVAGVSVQAATLSITELRDLDFGNLTPSVDRAVQRLRLCVNMEPAGPYRLTALGSGTGGAFALLDSAGTHAVRLGLRARSARSRPQTLRPGVPISGLSARAPRPDGGCARPYLVLNVELQTDDLRRVPAGAYGGTLELMVAPE